MASHYDVLGVRRDSVIEEIKQAYHRLALEYHPDKNPSPESAEKMRQINEAYRVLGDPSLRAEYDVKTFSSRDANPYARWYGQQAESFRHGNPAGANPVTSPGYEAPRRAVVYESVTLFSLKHLLAAAIVGLAFDITIAAAFVILRIDPNTQYGPVFMVGFAAAFAFLPPFVAVLLLRRELNARSEAGLCGSIALIFALMLATGGTVLTCCLLPLVFIVAGWIIGGFAGKISWDVLRG